jgi:hypothetical protein
MRRALLVSLIVLPLEGCHLGPGLDEFPFARRPEGVTVDASGRQGNVAGELLEVQDAGLLLLSTEPGTASKRIVLLPYGAIREARFGALGATYALKDGQPPGAATRERLQRVSRFPQGLSEAILRRLLDTHGQAEVQKAVPD